jgi:hypothetical protein
MISMIELHRRRLMALLPVGALLLIGAVSVAAEQLRVVTQNALNYSGQTDRLPAFHTIMRSLSPDLVCLQEIINEEAVDQLLSFVFLQINDDWVAVPFHNGPDTDNAFFYRA